MAFQTVTYQLDNGDLGLIRLSAEKVALYGSEPSGAINESARVYQKKNNKKYGVRARFASYARTIVSGPDSFVKYLTIPRSTPAELAASPASVSYKSNTWDLMGLIGEDRN